VKAGGYRIFFNQESLTPGIRRQDIFFESFCVFAGQLSWAVAGFLYIFAGDSHGQV
jgi:hypothetical protein